MRVKRAASKRLDSGTDGFAAVDALIALVILAGTVAVALQAADAGRRAAALSAETRRAELLLRRLTDEARPRPGAWSGRAGGFDWRVEVAERPAAVPGLRPCNRRVELRDARSGRAYRADLVDFCAPPEPDRED